MFNESGSIFRLIIIDLKVIFLEALEIGINLMWFSLTLGFHISNSTVAELNCINLEEHGMANNPSFNSMTDSNHCDSYLIKKNCEMSFICRMMKVPISIWKEHWWFTDEWTKHTFPYQSKPINIISIIV